MSAELFLCRIPWGCRAAGSSLALLLIYNNWVSSEAFQGWVSNFFSPLYNRKNLWINLTKANTSHDSFPDKTPTEINCHFSSEPFSCERTARIGTLSVSYNFDWHWNRCNSISRPSTTNCFLLFSSADRKHHVGSKSPSSSTQLPPWGCSSPHSWLWAGSTQGRTLSLCRARGCRPS